MSHYDYNVNGVSSMFKQILTHNWFYCQNGPKPDFVSKSDAVPNHCFYCFAAVGQSNRPFNLLCHCWVYKPTNVFVVAGKTRRFTRGPEWRRESPFFASFYLLTAHARHTPLPG